MPSAFFYTSVIGFLSGVLLRSFLYLPVEVSLLFLLVATGLLVLWRRSLSEPDASPIHSRAGSILLGVALFVALFGFGTLRFFFFEEQLLHTALDTDIGTNVTLTGEVVREPDVRAALTLLTVAVEDTRVLVSTDRQTGVTYGDTVTITGKLELPEAFATDLGRTFDYPGYLRARGITHTMSFTNPVVEMEVPATSLPYQLYRFKQYFLERLSLVLTEPQMGLAAGLLLGVRSALGEEVEEAFRISGVIHIVVLSGYNIMLVVLFVMYVLAFLLPFRQRLVVGMVAIALFALLVGYSPSVLRASVMAGLLLLSTLLSRPYVILRALFLAATLMVAINPYLLRYDIGFQLSCMATLGLILVAPKLEEWFAAVPLGWMQTRSFLVATIATQIAVAPLLLYHMGQWSLIAVPANVLILPMVPVAMLLTFITGLAALISTTLATPLAFLAHISLSYIIVLAETLARVPGAAISVPAFPLYLVPAMYLGLGYLWYRFLWIKSGDEEAAEIETLATTIQTATAGWTIVEEESLLPNRAVPNHKVPLQIQTSTARILKGGTADAIPPGDTPIFFR